LSAGETVQVVQFYDSNGNGSIDGPDVVVRGEVVTDGQGNLVAGATNINVLRDEDGAANGIISASLRFALAPELARGVGHYLFQFSSPSNHFSATNVPFTVESAPYAQKVQGAVKSNGTNVPYALVALIQVGAGPIGYKGIVGGAADAAGNYTLKAPPDTYGVIASWPGFVMNAYAAPQVTLAPGATITTNLNLIAATTTLAGKLVDSDNPALPALPYCQITAFNTNLFFTVTATDSNANFSLPVTPGLWTIRASWQSVVAKSYLTPQAGSLIESKFNTSQGPVTGAAVAFKRATALIYGTVEDNHSNAVPGITLSASADGGAFDALGMSDTNGLYALAIEAGGGYVEVQELDAPPTKNYLWTGYYFGTSDGHASNIDLTGIVPTAHFHGRLLDDTGAPVSDLGLFAEGSTGPFTGGSQGVTDTNGFFDLPVFGGGWTLHFESEFFPDLIFPTYYSFYITDGIDVTNTVIARKATGSISGYVRNQSGGAIQGLTVNCTTSVGSTNYNLSAYTDPNGNYSFAVFNGTWTISPDLYVLYAAGYYPANPTNITVPPTNPAANFIVTPIPPPQITTTSLPDATVGRGYFLRLDATNGVEPLSWSISSGALPGGLSLDSNFGELSGAPTNAGLFNFTVKATDQRGSNGTSGLSIRVLGSGPQAPTLDLPKLLPGNVFSVRVTGVAGQSYTLQFATRLTNWTGILTTNALSDVFYIEDNQATNVSRLYRVRLNP